MYRLQILIVTIGATFEITGDVLITDAGQSKNGFTFFTRLSNQYQPVGYINQGSDPNGELAIQTDINRTSYEAFFKCIGRARIQDDRPLLYFEPERFG